MADRQVTVQPLNELISAAERFMVTVTANCAASTPGHDAKCQCGPHRASREAMADLQAVIDRIRRA